MQPLALQDSPGFMTSMATAADRFHSLKSEQISCGDTCLEKSNQSQRTEDSDAECLQQRKPANGRPPSSGTASNPLPTKVLEDSPGVQCTEVDRDEHGSGSSLTDEDENCVLLAIGGGNSVQRTEATAKMETPRVGADVAADQADIGEGDDGDKTEAGASTDDQPRYKGVRMRKW